MLKKTPILFLSLILLFPIGTSFADKDYGTSDSAFSPTEINQAFANMKNYVTQDENLHIVIDKNAATVDTSVSDLDIEIMYEFQMHSDEIIDAVANGGMSSENIILINAFDRFMSGSLQNLFEYSDTNRNLLSSSTTVPTATYYNSEALHPFSTSVLPASITGAALSSLQACGPFGFGNLHPEPPIEYHSNAMINTIKQQLTSNGYHVVSGYATLHHTLDYAKIVTYSGYGGCDDGEFRDQARIVPYNSYWGTHNTQSNEPNPEIFSYVNPTFWWGSYVAYWHLHDHLP